MNSSAKISFFLGLRQIFQESFQCAPFVFKKTTLYFGSIWLPLAIACIVAINLLSPNPSSGISLMSYLKTYIILSLHLFEHCFIVFIVPYYVFAFLNQKENKATPNFWDFVTENVFPLVVNHIKTVLTILLFLLLLIIPGLIKAIRLALVTPVTFFDEDFKNNNISALKISHKTTKGFFFGLLSLSMFILIANIALKSLFHKSSQALSEHVPVVFMDILGFIAIFYFSCFGYLLMTQTYFVLKRYSK